VAPEVRGLSLRLSPPERADLTAYVTRLQGLAKQRFSARHPRWQPRAFPKLQPPPPPAARRKSTAVDLRSLAQNPRLQRAPRVK
jgi:hypothetical protein